MSDPSPNSSTTSEWVQGLAAGANNSVSTSTALIILRVCLSIVAVWLVAFSPATVWLGFKIFMSVAKGMGIAFWFMATLLIEGPRNSDETLLCQIGAVACIISSSVFPKWIWLLGSFYFGVALGLGLRNRASMDETPSNPEYAADRAPPDEARNYLSDFLTETL